MRLDRHHKGRPRGDLFRREQGRGFGWGVWGQQVFASGRIPTSSGSSVRSATNAHSSSINDFGPIINPVANIRLPPTRGRAIHPTGVAIADVALARTPVRAAMSGSDPVGSGSVKGGRRHQLRRLHLVQPHARSRLRPALQSVVQSSAKPLVCAGVAHLSR